MSHRRRQTQLCDREFSFIEAQKSSRKVKKNQWQARRHRFLRVSDTSSGLAFVSISLKPTIRESGYENCPFFKMDEDNERVVDCTTPNFNGIISMMDLSRSWAARRCVPRCYTLAVSEALPEGLQIRFLVLGEIH
ncbi:hypothetical protein GQ457_04G021420 [Hibiscus cannabinus]